MGLYFGSSLKDPLVAGRGRKSPQNSMGLPAIPVPYGWIRVPRSGRRQTLIYIWSLPLARSMGSRFPFTPRVLFVTPI